MRNSETLLIATNAYPVLIGATKPNSNLPHSEECFMADTPTKVPVKTGRTSTATSPYGWYPFQSLRREMDRLFGNGFWRLSFARGACNVRLGGKRPSFGPPRLAPDKTVDNGKVRLGGESPSFGPSLHKPTMDRFRFLR
jgi:hypothetical protein